MTGATKRGGAGRNGGGKSRATKSAKPRPAQDCASRKEVADYIASMLEGMRVLAHQTQLPFLSYLIGIALGEAKGEKVKQDLSALGFDQSHELAGVAL